MGDERFGPDRVRRISRALRVPRPPETPAHPPVSVDMRPSGDPPKPSSPEAAVRAALEALLYGDPTAVKGRTDLGGYLRVKRRFDGEGRFSVGVASAVGAERHESWTLDKIRSHLECGFLLLDRHDPVVRGEDRVEGPVPPPVPWQRETDPTLLAMVNDALRLSGGEDIGRFDDLVLGNDGLRDIAVRAMSGEPLRELVDVALGRGEAPAPRR